MRLLLAATAVAAAFAVPTAAHATHYTRACGGVLDVECRGRTCPMDCFTNDCLVWVDPLHSPFTAVCVGPVVE